MKNIQGKRPGSDHAVRNAVARVSASGPQGVAVTRYANSGRRYGADGGKYLLTEKQRALVVDFVKKWRHKRFCTCPYVKRELMLEATPRTIARVLNRAGFHWRQVAKKSPLTKKQLEARKAFVTKYGHHPPLWWVQNMHLAFDGVTLTKAPKNLESRQKHAAQRILHMWMRQGEKMDPKLHTYNRYGVQLGKKVPLWGGFTGDGKFTLRIWSARAKYTKEEWAQELPKVRKAAAMSSHSRGVKRLKVWHDNEPCIAKQPENYRKAGLTSVLFPPNSGDLNPIETVWARLRKDLALMEFEDLKNDKVIQVASFKRRVAQLLRSYSIPGILIKKLFLLIPIPIPILLRILTWIVRIKMRIRNRIRMRIEIRLSQGPGEQYSYLERLVRGMPKRLARCKKNSYGPCGK